MVKLKEKKVNEKDKGVNEAREKEKGESEGQRD